ncbi:ATP-binding protein [Streptomyces marincola]|uniref:ATP-binding protein n=1 Tax=Streptomyces marincola TaxID=2878388 RepID=UPI001CF31142|nr:ATP-binding protein [Streptomyces marincola]UCM91278.1 ATP-binding protein [Streptomyces marincola]
MSQYLQDPALWGLVVGAPLAASVIYRGRKSNARLREEKAEVETRHAELQDNFSDAVEEARLRAEDATKTALKSAMRTLQGLANEQQLAISKVQGKYGDQEFLQDLLEIDHMNSQFGRRAQSVSVLCDGWLGRQRSVASVYDVARSAKGRIRHFTRVEIRSQTSFAVISQVVEPVALVLAELLDNATSYSAPETTIDINIRTVPKGVCVIIDDAGVGMNEEEKSRAARLLSGEHPVSVTELGNPPQFGFAVIGVLAARYGFSVSVDTASPYGGVRAVVLLPQELLTSMPEPQTPPAAEFPADEPEPEATGTTAGGLPKRRRRGAIAIVPRSEASADGNRARSSEETASIMGAFQRGTQSGRIADTSREGSETQ